MRLLRVTAIASFRDRDSMKRAPDGCRTRRQLNRIVRVIDRGPTAMATLSANLVTRNLGPL